MDPLCVRPVPDKNQIQRTKNALEANVSLIQQFSAAYNLAGNEVRLKILYALYSEERLCVCDLTDILGISTPGVSQHLKKLKEGGLIESNKVAQRIYYNLSAACETEFSNTFSVLSQYQPAKTDRRITEEINTNSCCQ